MTLQELETKVEELNLEIEKLKKEKETGQTKPLKSEYEKEYWYVSPIGECLTYTNISSVFNDKSYDFGNYYRTKELAEQDAKEQKLRNRVRQLRDMLCKGYKFTQRSYNYCIYYNKREKYFAFYETYDWYIGGIYFDTAGHAKQVCNILNDEFDAKQMEEFFDGN